jgi:hypothetical protein
VSRPARPEDVDEICAALPSTELGTSWGDVPTWKVPAGDEGRGFVLYRHPHPTVIDPESGFTIDHFRNFNAVLVQQSRLGELGVEGLTELVQEAWLAVAPKRLCREFLADG